MAFYQEVRVRVRPPSGNEPTLTWFCTMLADNLNDAVVCSLHIGNGQPNPLVICVGKANASISPVLSIGNMHSCTCAGVLPGPYLGAQTVLH